MPGIADSDYVYRALRNNACLTNDKRSASEEAFRMRPNEDGLSVGLSITFARSRIDAKGVARLMVGDIRSIQVEGIRLDVKHDNPAGNSDHALIVGIPGDNETLQRAFAARLKEKSILVP